MSDSDESIDKNNDNAKKEETDENNRNEIIDIKSLPKHMRRRYWNSQEELRLIFLWRQNYMEVTELDKNLPIFRTISIGMKEAGFFVNAQEVRRKLKSIKNKYITERRRMNDPTEAKNPPTWRLYRLVDCVIAPSVKNEDLHFEEKKLSSVLKRNQQDPLYQILLSGMPTVDSLRTVEAGESITILPALTTHENNFAIENKLIADTIAYGYQNNLKLSYTPRTQRPSEAATAQARKLANVSSEITSNEQLATNTVTFGTLGYNGGFGLLKRRATLAAIDRIRLENRNLIEEVVISSKRLKHEEQQLKFWEATIEQMSIQYQKLFKQLNLSSP